MSHKLNLSKAESWYQDGLKFKCTGCGKCCTGGPGAVWITDEDVAELSKHLNLKEEEFIAQYTRMINGRRSLNEDPKNFDCIFLVNKQCTVYHLRPRQCRTYPWWPQILKSKATWDQEAKWCEGIDHKEAPTIPYEEIEKNLQ